MMYAGFENHADLSWDGFEAECAKVRDYHAKVNATWQEMKEKKKEKAWLRRMCRTDLYFLLYYILGRKDMFCIEDRETGEKLERPWLFRRCAEVQAAPDGYLDIWARDHYKTTIITYAKTIQDILIDPELTVCIYAYNMGLAKKVLRQMKHTFESCEALKRLFPDILYSDEHETGWKDSKGVWHRRQWTDDSITVKRRTNPKEATVECSGLVEGQRTGGHYRLLIFDDTVTLDSVRTSEQIRKTTEAAFMAFNTGSSGDLRIRFIGTRYSLYDTYSDILGKGRIKARIHPCYLMKEDGTLSDTPALYTQETIDFKKANTASGVFETQMLCDPKANIAMAFDPLWIRYVDEIDWSVPMNIGVICDPAGSTKTRSDFTVFWVVAHTCEDKYIVLDLVRDKIELDQKWDWLKILVSKYTNDGRKPTVYYEQVSMQSDISHFEKMKSVESFDMEIKAVSGRPKLRMGTASAGLPLKEQRIGALQPLFKQGRISFYRNMGPKSSNFEKRDVDMLQQFIEDEYSKYPFCRHDDGLDCLSRIADLETGLLLSKPDRPREKAKEEKPKQYDVYRIEDSFVPY